MIEQCAGLHDLVDQPEIERGRWLVCAGAVNDGLEMLRRVANRMISRAMGGNGTPT